MFSSQKLIQRPSGSFVSTAGGKSLGRRMLGDADADDGFVGGEIEHAFDRVEIAAAVDRELLGLASRCRAAPASQGA